MREVTVRWNPIGAMRLEADGPHGQKVTMDSTPQHGGDGQGFSPKILLMVALGGCTAIDVLSLMRKMRQEFSGYYLEIKGWEEEEMPKKFQRITVEHVIEGRNLNKEMIDRAIRLSHEKYCGVSASLGSEVEIEMTSRLVEV